MSKKIIHLVQALDSGGCENMLLRTVPLMHDFNHKIITLNHKGELAEQFEKKNIPIININQKNLLDIFSYFKLLKKIKKEKPDIIITYLFHADFVGRLFLQLFTKIKVIPFLRTTYNHKKYWPARLFEKNTKYFVNNYLANSESVKNFYIKNIGVKKEKIAVIPNGIDVDFFDKVERNENLRESFGIKKEETVIICVANLHINKGHKYLLEAFEKIYENNQKIKLLLIGEGDEKEGLLNQIKNYKSKKNILFLGKRKDVPYLLKISDIFVLPTLFEGMSNAIMEAMACGLPIIATDIQENRELIKDNESGKLIPAKNSIALAKNINQFINEADLNNIHTNAKDEISKNFNINIIVKKWTTFIKETLYER